MPADPRPKMTLDGNCLHFICGETLYAIHNVTGQAYVTHFRRTNGKQEVLYLRIEYDGLPHEVKRAWLEYRARTAS